MKHPKEIFDIEPGTTLSFGVTKMSDGVQFALQCPPDKKCYLNLYIIGKKEPEYKIELKDEYRQGGACFVKLSIKDVEDESICRGQRTAQILSQKYEYTYEADGKEFTDPYAQKINGRERWGKRKESSEDAPEVVTERAGICLEEFDWEDDVKPGIPFSDLILYQLHVRGYTRHSSSGVSAKGTYKGLQEKIPYISELGVNGVILLPCYEFDEIRREYETGSCIIYDEEEEKRKPALNYWGYGTDNTYYMAPKSSYASNPKDSSDEFKEMIKSFHKAGIEVIMDIYFSPGTNICLMTDCLRNWVINYHIDGFRINQDVMPSTVVASDPILSGVKLIASYWNMEELNRAGADKNQNLLAEYNEGFMTDARKFLKGDEGMVGAFSGRLRRNPSDYSVINFITHVNGFTLKDLVSYDIKHNESNGEDNHDGTDYNFSWNCGVEGKTRKKIIVERRKSQMRNAFMMLMCSQGTPMILAGDEFGNTQLGNNNPYCHDDNVTWLEWRHSQSDLELLNFVKKLIYFRKSHPVLHQAKGLTMMDYRGVGIPDISIHGTQAWKADFTNYSRMLAVLLCGKYAKKADGTDDDDLYIIFNMFWEEKEFDLPNLPLGMDWYLVIETSEGEFKEIHKADKTKKKRGRAKPQKIRKVNVKPRSIAIYVGLP